MCIHRGLLVYLNSEAELACVLGHEIGHDVARHPARCQARKPMLGFGATATAILTRSPALAEMPDVGALAGCRATGASRNPRPTASASSMSVEKFKKQQLRLLKATYPKGEPKPGELFKIVQ